MLHVLVQYLPHDNIPFTFLKIIGFYICGDIFLFQKKIRIHVLPKFIQYSTILFNFISVHLFNSIQLILWFEKFGWIKKFFRSITCDNHHNFLKIKNGNVLINVSLFSSGVFYYIKLNISIKKFYTVVNTFIREITFFTSIVTVRYKYKYE